MNQFDIIVADPPWAFGDKLSKMKDTVNRSAESQYKTMTLDDIKHLDVRSLSNKDAALLALWVPSTMLPDGLDVMKSWGFTLKQTFVWVKVKKDHAQETDWNLGTRIGMGRLFRQTHEIALLGTSGKGSIYKKLENKSQRSVAFDLNQGHSIKPDTLQNRLSTMFPSAKKLEMFGRRNLEGWTVIGDGVTGLDVRESIKKLSENLE